MAYPGRPSEELYDAGFSEILVTEKSPKKLSVRQQRVLVRNIKKLRENNPSFSFLDLIKDSGVSPQMMLPNER